jgi:hypothetical protein
MEWVQQFYKAAISGSTVQLSPLTTATTGCTRDISRPPYLAAAQVSITVAGATPPTDFYPTSACQRYEVSVRIVN